jgi:hypothetical protein
MALAANYPSPFGGAPFTYFIVGEVRQNRYSGNASVVMYGFVDHVAREAMSAYVTLEAHFDATQWTKDATIAQIYELIKTTPHFEGATDA